MQGAPSRAARTSSPGVLLIRLPFTGQSSPSRLPRFWLASDEIWDTNECSAFTLALFLGYKSQHRVSVVLFRSTQVEQGEGSRALPAPCPGTLPGACHQGEALGELRALAGQSLLERLPRSKHCHLLQRRVRVVAHPEDVNS